MAGPNLSNSGMRRRGWRAPNQLAASRSRSYHWGSAAKGPFRVGSGDRPLPRNPDSNSGVEGNSMDERISDGS
jgi:hypothetical protein